eukprot:COSAG04_NODE_26104_length_299_cov_0.990000_1_plen_65_part_10
MAEEMVGDGVGYCRAKVVPVTGRALVPAQSFARVQGGPERTPALPGPAPAATRKEGAVTVVLWKR